MSVLPPSNSFNLDGIDSVYRVFRIEHFLNFLEEKSLTLIPPRMWDDPFENFFLKARVQVDPHTIASMEELYSQWYGLCWTLESETDAMWRLYAPDKDGIIARSTIPRIRHAFWDSSEPFASLMFFAGRVAYHPRMQIEEFMRKTSFHNMVIGGSGQGLAELLCVKRPEFQYEAEIRLLYCDVQRRIVQGNFAKIHMDPNSLIDEVVLDPRMGFSVFKQYEVRLNRLGFTGRISQSQLYHFTPSLIPGD